MGVSGGKAQGIGKLFLKIKHLRYMGDRMTSSVVLVNIERIECEGTCDAGKRVI